MRSNISKYPIGSISWMFSGTGRLNSSMRFFVRGWIGKMAFRSCFFCISEIALRMESRLSLLSTFSSRWAVMRKYFCGSRFRFLRGVHFSSAISRF